MSTDSVKRLAAGRGVTIGDVVPVGLVWGDPTTATAAVRWRWLSLLVVGVGCMDAIDMIDAVPAVGEPDAWPDEPDGEVPLETIPPELDPTAVADPRSLSAKAGARERYDHNYVVDVTWTVNDHHRKRFRGTVTGRASIQPSANDHPCRVTS